MSAKHMERCSTSLPTWEMYIKSMMRYSKPIKMTEIKIVTMNSGKNAEKPNHSCIASENLK
jgi:hypothetical protein